MTKSDLRNGMVLLLRDKRAVMFLSNAFSVDRIVGETWCFADSYREDLTRKDDKTLDIIGVYKPKSNMAFSEFRNGINSKDFETIWNRVDAKEMTIEEISEELGYEVKIVKESKC